MKKDANIPLVKRLGDILNKDNVSNSYYDDENYNPCKTPNFDRAYNELISQAAISSEDLKTTYPLNDREKWGKVVEFPFADIVKIVLVGDFDGQYKTTSSMEKNFQTISSLYDLTKKNLSPQEHKEFWTSKLDPISREEMWKLNGRDHQLAYLQACSMVETAAKRFDFYSFKTSEEIQAGHKASKKLLNIPEFLEEVNPPYRIDACTELVKRTDEGLEKELLLKSLKTAASNVKHKSYEGLAKIEHYDIRRVAISSLLFGKSQDTYFDNLVKSIESFENKISKGGRELDITV